LKPSLPAPQHVVALRFIWRDIRGIFRWMIFCTSTRVTYAQPSGFIEEFANSFGSCRGHKFHRACGRHQVRKFVCASVVHDSQNPGSKLALYWINDLVKTTASLDRNLSFVIVFAAARDTCSHSTRITLSVSGMMIARPDGTRPWNFPSRMKIPFSYWLTMRAERAQQNQSEQQCAISILAKRCGVPSLVLTSLSVSRPSTNNCTSAAELRVRTQRCTTPRAILRNDFNQTAIAQPNALCDYAHFSNDSVHVRRLILTYNLP